MANKKSQTEMLGLAVVVILISVGLIFVIGNTLKKTSTPSEKKVYSEKQLAVNILGSILSTTTACKQDKISTLMIDCGRGTPVFCNEEVVEGVTIGETDNVCQYLNETITYLLDNTLKKWNKKYEFLMYERRESPLINITNEADKCIVSGVQTYQYIQREFYYLPLHPGTVTVELGLCS